MKATIVIPTRDRWATLARTLPTVLAQEAAGGEFEVLVIDDGSGNAPCDVVQRASDRGRIRLLRQDGRGPAAARNRGLAEARGEVVLFLDDDICCPPGLLALHLAAHRERQELVSYGPILLAPDSPPSLIAESTGAWYEGYWRRVALEGGIRLPADTLLAANCAISRTTLVALGGFDEAIASKEDTELGIRLWKRGTPMRFVPDAICHELFVKSTARFVADDGERWGRAEIYLCRKHPEYRPHSGLTTLGGGGLRKRAARRVLSGLPPVLETLVLPLYRLAEAPFVPKAVRRRAMAAALLHHRAAFLRGARREAGGWGPLRAAFGARLPALLYHYVGPPVPGVPEALVISPQAFARHMRWLALLGYEGIRLSDWSSWREEGGPLPRKPVAITFDDGYAATAAHALPMLERHGFAATVFAVTGQIGGSNAWDAAKGVAELPLMNDREIRAWSRRAVEFGAHSRSHADLTRLAPQARSTEIAGSRDDLEGLTGRSVTSFAYPYGYHDAATRAMVAEAFDAAVTCDEGMNSLATDPCLMRRTLVQPGDNFIDYAGRVLFGFSPLNRLRSRMAIRRRLGSALGILRRRRAA